MGEGSYRDRQHNVSLSRPIALLVVVVFVGCSHGGLELDYDYEDSRDYPGPDPSFGGRDGVVTLSIGDSDDRAMGVAVQHDGRIIVGGYARIGPGYDIAVARLQSPGDLDRQFGGQGSGIVCFDISDSNDWATSLALQPDDKIVMAGHTAGGPDRDIFVMRLSAGGSPDPSFGDGDGVVVFDVAGYDDWCHGLALQPDGKIIAGGYAWNGTDSDIVLLRLNPDGSLDSSFGDSGGVVVTDIGYEGAHGGLGTFRLPEERVCAIALSQDGHIVVAGSVSGTYPLKLASGTTIPWHDSRAMLVRYDSSGTLDTGFGEEGVATTIYKDAYSAVAVDREDRILAAGGRWYLDRLTASGKWDARFDGDLGDDRRLGLDSWEDRFPRRIAIDEHGAIFVAGYTRTRGSDYDFAAVRYTSGGVRFDGVRDPSFIFRTDIRDNDWCQAMAIQPDGRILMAGYTHGASENDDFAVVRYLP
jgi:uncharacterized delta-60 repeat protein